MSNIYRSLKDLLPESDRLSVGRVSTVNQTSNTTTLTLLDNSSITVKGVGISVGDMAYFKGGELGEKAPDLPTFEIDV